MSRLLKTYKNEMQLSDDLEGFHLGQDDPAIVFCTPVFVLCSLRRLVLPGLLARSCVT